MISYYELLKMIKEDNAPELITLKLTSREVEYQAYYDNDKFNYYGLCDPTEQDGDYAYYLAESLLESMMFDKNIKIILQETKIEKLDIRQEKNIKNNWKWKCNGYCVSTPQKIMADKINQLIDEVNTLKNQNIAYSMADQVDY